MEINIRTTWRCRIFATIRIFRFFLRCYIAGEKSAENSNSLQTSRPSKSFLYCIPSSGYFVVLLYFGSIILTRSVSWLQWSSLFCSLWTWTPWLWRRMRSLRWKISFWISIMKWARFANGLVQIGSDNFWQKSPIKSTKKKNQVVNLDFIFGLLIKINTVLRRLVCPTEYYATFCKNSVIVPRSISTPIKEDKFVSSLSRLMGLFYLLS